MKIKGTLGKGTLSAVIVFGTLTMAGQAMAATTCGANTGEAATGEPIIVGGIYGNAPPGDWTSSTDSAAAYLKCVNANGGIHGRPIDYRDENDAWNPESAARPPPSWCWTPTPSRWSAMAPSSKWP